MGQGKTSGVVQIASLVNNESSQSKYNSVWTKNQLTRNEALAYKPSTASSQIINKVHKCESSQGHAIEPRLVSQN